MSIPVCVQRIVCRLTDNTVSTLKVLIRDVMSPAIAAEKAALELSQIGLNASISVLQATLNATDIDVSSPIALLVPKAAYIDCPEFGSILEDANRSLKRSLAGLENERMRLRRLIGNLREIEARIARLDKLKQSLDSLLDAINIRETGLCP